MALTLISALARGSDGRCQNTCNSAVPIGLVHLRRQHALDVARADTDGFLDQVSSTRGAHGRHEPAVRNQ